jgi:hypothetical protein
MASINGIEIKNLKSFLGHGGEPLSQGNIYFNGKKVGFWTQDSHGGPDIYDFDTSIVDSVVESYKNTDDVSDEFKKIFNLDMLLYDLMFLIDDEKTYKKITKKGNTVLITVSDGYRYIYASFKDKDSLSQYKEEFINDATSKCFQGEPLRIKTYSSLDDFNINIM